jgi:hypothetical protein
MTLLMSAKENSVFPSFQDEKTDSARQKDNLIIGTLIVALLISMTKSNDLGGSINKADGNYFSNYELNGPITDETSIIREINIITRNLVAQTKNLYLDISQEEDREVQSILKYHSAQRVRLRAKPKLWLNHKDMKKVNYKKPTRTRSYPHMKTIRLQYKLKSLEETADELQ